MPDAWNPDRYGAFTDERSRPFLDLLAMVREEPIERVLDLGCGTGRGSRQLHAHTGAASTLAIDRSDSMLERATQHDAHGLRFQRADVAEFAPAETFNLVFSNACLHWLDDHEMLWARLVDWVRPGGQLAIQIPANHTSVPHLTAGEVAAREPHRSALDGYERVSPVLEPGAYAELLHRLGAVEQEVALRVYPHLLDSREAVVEWMRGTTLTTYEERMSPEDFERFVADYERELLPRLPDERPFFYPFRRILMWARTSA